MPLLWLGRFLSILLRAVFSAAAILFRDDAEQSCCRIFNIIQMLLSGSMAGERQRR